MRLGWGERLLVNIGEGLGVRSWRKWKDRRRGLFLDGGVVGIIRRLDLEEWIQMGKGKGKTREREREMGRGKETDGTAYEYSIACMNFSGSPAVMGMSTMRREVTGRRPEGSGRSRNWSVHAVEAEELGVSESLRLFACSRNSGISPAFQMIATRMAIAPQVNDKRGENTISSASTILSSLNSSTLTSAASFIFSSPSPSPAPP